MLAGVIGEAGDKYVRAQLVHLADKSAFGLNAVICFCYKQQICRGPRRLWLHHGTLSSVIAPHHMHPGCRGANLIRLDAFGYTTKKRSTNCFFVEPEIWDLLERVRDKLRCAETKPELLCEVHEHYLLQKMLAEKGLWVYDFALPMLCLQVGAALALVAAVCLSCSGRCTAVRLRLCAADAVPAGALHCRGTSWRCICCKCAACGPCYFVGKLPAPCRFTAPTFTGANLAVHAHPSCSAVRAPAACTHAMQPKVTDHSLSWRRVSGTATPAT